MPSLTLRVDPDLLAILKNKAKLKETTVTEILLGPHRKLETSKGVQVGARTPPPGSRLKQPQAPQASHPGKRRR